MQENKRFIYYGVLLVIVLFCALLNYTFSAFTASTNNRAVDLTVKTLDYTTVVDNVSTNMITATNNAITRSNIVLNSTNNINTKYELYYEIYSDSAMQNKVNSVSGLNVKYSSKSLDTVSGVVNSLSSKSIRVIITNSTSTTYYIKLLVNSGYSHNALTLKNMISADYIEEDFAVVTYIDGERVDDFPTTQNYTATVACYTPYGASSSTTGTCTWNNTAWELSVSNFSEPETRCEVTFTSTSN